jgi:hypothetical protein
MICLQEGKGLDIACEMLMGVYNDIWGIDEKKQSDSNNKRADSASANRKGNSTLPPLLEQPSKKGGFGKLGGRSTGIGPSRSLDEAVSLPFVGANKRGGDLEEDEEEDERAGAGEQQEQAGNREEEEEVPEEGSGDSESEKGDCNSADEGSMLPVISEWEDMLRIERMREAKDFSLFTLESIFELVESRLELQDRVHDKSPGVFKSFYGMC